jgi:cobyrinic acid a,c-diamide synthase
LNQIPRVVVAGLRGGSGKTTLSVGLAAALVGRGLRVTPYKKGPDYIDAGWLARAAGGPCFNLDPFLIGEEKLLSSFLWHFSGADLALIEGNRGLFDGMDAEGSYSTAKVARILKAPVILVVDCTKTTRTTAAVLLGVKRFERGLRLGGVVLNMVAGARHEAVTREAIRQYTGLPVLGALPRLQEMRLPERHMGLTPCQEHPEVGKAVERAAEAVGKHVDLERVLEVARAAPINAAKNFSNPPLPIEVDGLWGGGVSRGAPPPPLRIGVIRDSAFQFYYPENFEELTRRGAEVVEVSALASRGLPEIDALYIGGGFPETHAIALAGNSPFRRALRRAVEAGLPVYAECGGLMYLGESLRVGGRRYPMAGIFPVEFTLRDRPQGHGYTIVKVAKKNPFYKTGTVLRGHEFHYSALTRMKRKEGVSLVFRMRRGGGITDAMDGMCYLNALATYTHVHALGAPEWADGMIRAAMAFRRRRR